LNESSHHRSGWDLTHPLASEPTSSSQRVRHTSGVFCLPLAPLLSGVHVLCTGRSLPVVSKPTQEGFWGGNGHLKATQRPRSTKDLELPIYPISTQIFTHEPLGQTSFLTTFGFSDPALLPSTLHSNTPLRKARTNALCFAAWLHIAPQAPAFPGSSAAGSTPETHATSYPLLVLFFWLPQLSARQSRVVPERAPGRTWRQPRPRGGRPHPWISAAAQCQHVDSSEPRSQAALIRLTHANHSHTTKKIQNSGRESKPYQETIFSQYNFLSKLAPRIGAEMAWVWWLHLRMNMLEPLLVEKRLFWHHLTGSAAGGDSAIAGVPARHPQRPGNRGHTAQFPPLRSGIRCHWKSWFSKPCFASPRNSLPAPDTPGRRQMPAVVPEDRHRWRARSGTQKNKPRPRNNPQLFI